MEIINKSIIRYCLVFICPALMSASCSSSAGDEPMAQLIDRVMKTASHQAIEMDKSLGYGEFPRSVNPDGSLMTSDWEWWCSGFYPGELWYIYEYTRDPGIRKLAQKYTESLDSVKYIDYSHDLGFQLMCSYGNGYRLTHNPAYLKELEQGAVMLSRRFRKGAGILQSWGSDNRWQCPVIIDNMMNLELLEWVGETVSDTTMLNIASRHADTTLRNHFRDDNSCFHVLDYDTITGNVRSRVTAQGYADSSAWARGQSWALYGYTMMYRFTGDCRYLKHAMAVADYMISHPRMPQDGIPYWDFDAPDIPQACRDASAAAVMASALVELSQAVHSPELSGHYLQFAEKQLRSLSSDEYLAATGTNAGFLLKHSVGHKPLEHEVDVPLSYADYYFIEALIRYKRHLDGPDTD